MKKILSFVLLLCILGAGVLPASAYSSSAVLSELPQLLKMLEIMHGDENGDFYPEANVTRAEFAKIAVASSSFRNSVSKTSRTSPYHDVPYTHWGASYIRVASNAGYIKGYPDSTYRPENNVLLEEGVTIALKLLGYTDSDFGLAWPEGQMNLAVTLSLLDGIDKSVGQELTRGDVMMLIYNALNTKIKGTNTKAIESFGYSIAEDTVLIATSNEDISVTKDKIVTSAGTYKLRSGFDTTLSGLKGDLVIKNGEEAAAFFPSNTRAGQYIIYSVLGDSVIAYEGSATTTLDLGDNADVYYKSQKTTLSNVKNAIAMGDIITVYKNHSGETEYAVIGSGGLAGPYTVYNLSFDKTHGISENSTYFKDGRKATKADIEENDIIYYSKEINAVWAYSKKVTGIYESASPNKDNLTQITVSGVSYRVESGTAYTKLVTGGDYDFGDTVTLLLGRNGEVADVIGDKGSSGQTVGYLVETGTKSYTTEKGGNYSSYYAKVVDASGNEYEYRTSRDYGSYKNSVVRVTMSDGEGSVAKVKTNGSNVSGECDLSAGTFGDFKISKDVKVIDIPDTEMAGAPSYVTLFNQRIDGKSFTSKGVLHYVTNAKGEISELFLNDWSGDGYNYGIVTDLKMSGGSGSATRSGSYSYTVDSKGKTYTVSGSTKYSASVGDAVMFTANGGSIAYLTAIAECTDSIKSITQTQVVTVKKTYPISADVCVYKTSGINEWQQIPLSAAVGKTNAVAYYDKMPENGGQVRVIVVE